MNTAEILSMVKIFLPKGLSARVRNAITRRLQTAMAGRSEADDMPTDENAGSCKNFLSLQRRKRKMTLVRMEASHGRLWSHEGIDLVSDPDRLR